MDVSNPSSKFIADHNVIHQAQSQHHLLAMRADENVLYSHYHSIVDDDAFPQHIKFSVAVPFSSTLALWEWVMVVSSQGLLCFISNIVRGFDMNVVLWNPTIEKTLYIDVPRVLTNETHQTVVGFGVCPHTSDPKLVKITNNCGRELKKFDTKGNIVMQVEVFTLSSGVWRSLCSNLPRKSIAFKQHVAIGEFIYWLAYDRNVNCRIPLIMAFNMTSEEFKEVHLPYSLASGKSQLSIFKQMESLVVVEYSKSPVVWIMRNGDPNLFTKIFTIKTPNAGVLGFRKNGEAIIVTNDELKEVFAYKPTSHQMNSVGIKTKYSFVATTYMETLLLLDYKYSKLKSKFERCLSERRLLELQARFGN